MEFSSTFGSRYKKEKQSLKAWFKLNQSSIRAWIIFFVCALVLYHLFSDGNFSFILTLSSLIAMFSFIMIIYQMENSQSAKGISFKMIECYVILIFARLCSIIPFQGYNPFDKSGDWLYQLVEAITFCLAGSILYSGRKRFKNSYDSENDSFSHFYLIGGSLILAFLFHPNLDAFLPADVSWAFALYLETVCVFPQLYMFQKQGKVEPFTSHFLAGQALSKALSFIFWIFTHPELNDKQHILHSYTGLWVMAMQIVQLILMGDFIFHYLRCLSRGVPIEFIMSENV